MANLFSTPKPPAAPNPYQVGQAQTGSNLSTAIGSSYLNNVNQVTPYGSVVYSYGVPANPAAYTGAPPATASPAAAAQPAARPAQLALPAPSAANRPGQPVAQPQQPAGAALTPWQRAVQNQQTGQRAVLPAGSLGPGGGGGGGAGGGGGGGLGAGGGAGQAGGGGGGGHTAPAAPAATKPNYATANATGVLSLPGQKTAIPAVTQTTTLSPQQQALLNQSQALTLKTGDVTSKLVGNVPTDKLSFAGAPAMPTGGNMPDIGQTNAEARDAAYKQQTMMMDPQYQVQEKQLHDSLQDQGIPPGSEAYNQAMDAFNRQKSFAYDQARTSAIGQGYQIGAQTFGQGMQEQQTGYNQGLQSRQQGIGEATQLYNQPISTLGSLMSAYGGGNVQSPQGAAYPSPIAPTDMTGAFGLAQQGNQAAYQAQLAQQQGTMGDLSGLAGMIALGAGKW